MVAFRHSFGKRLAFMMLSMMLVLVVIPPSRAHATVRVLAFELDTYGLPYLLAGDTIDFSFGDDRALGTSLEYAKISYSADNGLNWKPVLDLKVNDPGFGTYGSFSLPEDPTLTSAQIMLETLYSPLIGSNSYNRTILGPFKIRQAGGITDLTATSHANGSVTLSWSDNTNMESYYQIKRVGGKGKEKIFYVRDTMEHTGNLTYLDKETSSDTVYVYSVLPVIDQFKLPDFLKTGEKSLIVKTKKVLLIIEIGNDKIQGPIKLPDLTGGGGTKQEPANPPPATQPPAEPTEAMLEQLAAGASEWAKHDVKDAIKLNLTTNAVLGRYKDSITREEFASIAVKLYEALSGKMTGPISSNPFTDTVNADVLKANKLGIVFGSTLTEFSPHATITRQEMCVMLLRAIKAAKPAGKYDTSVKTTFADEAKIAAWAKNSVHFAANAGVMGGVGGGRIDPLGKTTREQSIILIRRAYLAFMKT
ncbi:S-layer homology domain-containing protein [Paenibacillus sp. BC26]|uniref:S-layer homology domain-containing protein n=1 Tax=Paenibacillus sp. BC26 TaxID=1881032 RepID=UPI0008EA00A8|nr:S-layer homology domain-containing protein [Paenibacillus sp. BC26]SFS58113.1 S-layer homology domain-containing protein [Paenibacillus sp. BC26]